MKPPIFLLDLIYFQKTQSIQGRRKTTKQLPFTRNLAKLPMKSKALLISRRNLEEGMGDPVDAATLADETILIPSL